MHFRSKQKIRFGDIDRAGIVGPDGPTHAGSFDLSYARALPNMVVMAPGDASDLDAMLGVSVYEVQGGVDFDAVTDAVLRNLIH